MHKLFFLIAGFVFLTITSNAAYIPSLTSKETVSEVANTQIMSDNIIQHYEALTGRHLTRVEKWVLTITQRKFFKKEKRKLHLGGFLLGFLSGVIGFLLAALIFSSFGWGAIVVGLGASLVATIVATYSAKDKNVGRSATWGLLTYLGAVLLYIIGALIAIISCGCFD